MQYFNICGTWRLKTSLELHAQTGLHYSDRKCFNSSCTLEEIMYQDLIAEDEEEVEHFIDLLKKMLNVNKNERITPAQVLKHPFLAVEQHGDGPHMTVTMEEPYVPQQPEPLTSEEVYPSPPGINVSSNLDVTLDEYVKDVKFMTISEIRPVLQQLATALLCLEDLDIVHSDIKPENIMVLDKWQKPLQVKLIDFGLARQGPDIHPGSGGQSLLYRAPEVMLGLRHRQPIDMWSVGLTVAEMALGRPLLPGKHEYDIMKNIVNTLGEPPIYQLDAGPRSMQYFNICGTWRLKTSEELHARTGLHYSDRKCFKSSCTLEEVR
ncbi:homeodomain-interacting protein kinase 3 [Hippoglossus stenolepis]|uniref:homeodomain-interacting protein kinase 3 n=1 Tax=Hippoglossus stenolepis TaxID=195615 RepID=UPI001FAEFA60|nr:homeodomain-interacting protein kinase 3 [Hippoglossus stenolepis]